MQTWKFLNLISITLFHLYSVYALIYVLLYSEHLLSTILTVIFLGDLAGFGVTAGVHRLWCHRTYKASTGFRIFLALCYSLAGQNTIYDWVRDHRVHHKFSDTNADPHNVNRGFWFSHVGWLTMTKHKEVIEAGRKINMDDITSDPVVIWHTKYFTLLKIIICFIFPVIFHKYICNESWLIAFYAQSLVRYALSLNFTWLVNSAAHIWGYKPYNNKINPVENWFVSICAIGEGWHNYHHVFPYDYKAAELPFYPLNITTMFLDLAANLGLIWDRKEPTKTLVDSIIKSNKI